MFQIQSSAAKQSLLAKQIQKLVFIFLKDLQQVKFSLEFIGSVTLFPSRFEQSFNAVVVFRAKPITACIFDNNHILFIIRSRQCSPHRSFDVKQVFGRQFSKLTHAEFRHQVISGGHTHAAHARPDSHQPRTIQCNDLSHDLCSQNQCARTADSGGVRYRTEVSVLSCFVPDVSVKQTLLQGPGIRFADEVVVANIASY